jgi:hypothetical protein
VGFREFSGDMVEAAMWEVLSSLLTDPVSLREVLQAMMERERKTHGDPDTEARAWAAKLAESERKRDSYQEMFAAGAMTLDELNGSYRMKAARAFARGFPYSILSCRHSVRLLAREQLSSCVRLLDEERLGIDREGHPHIGARIQSRRDTHGPTDAQRLDRHIETRSTFSDPNRNSYHRRPLPLLIYLVRLRGDYLSKLRMLLKAEPTRPSSKRVPRSFFACLASNRLCAS